MTRLTNTIRDAISQDVLAHRFRAPVLERLAEARVLGDEVYAYLYPPSMLEKMRALPQQYFRTNDHIKTYALGERIDIYFGSYIWNLKGYHAIETSKRKTEDRIIAQCHYPEYSNCLDLSPELRAKVENLVQQRERHNEAYNLAHSQLNASLSAIGTINNLIKLWPEVEPFCKVWMEDSVKKPQLPAIPVASLNAMLDLPTDKVV